MKKTLLTAALVAALALPAAADDHESDQLVTYYKDILPIFQENCQGCHRPAGAAYGGMIAPMALTSYEEIRPWAKSIMQSVQSRDMPPWFASDHTRGVFETERTLSDEEIERVARWVRSGAPAGNPDDAPAPREFDSWNGWTIGKPDLIISLAEPYFVKDEISDINISLKAEMITEEMLPEARYIQAIEFRPGSDMVHHIIGSRKSAAAEEPGSTGMIGGIAPGTEPFRLPAGVGRLLEPNTQIWFQMHYNKEPGPGTGKWDRSQMGIKFHPKEMKVDRFAVWSAIGNNDFEIPPGHGDWKVGATRTFQRDTTIFGYMPHMHLRGKSAKYTAVYPDKTRELLLEVPEYDWNWQTSYAYKEPKRIPAGTRLEVEMSFMNTEERDAEVPLDLDTTRPVRFGGPTTDEMMLGWIDFAEDPQVEEIDKKKTETNLVSDAK